MNPFVSIVKNKSSIIGYKPIGEVLDIIQNGHFKKEIEQIRKYKAEDKKELADKIKLKLQSFIVTGKFTGGTKKENFSDFSRLIILDFDGIELNDLNQKFSIACNIPYTLGCFRSPRGNGLKIIVPITGNKEDYTNSYIQVSQYYEDRLGVKIDPSGKNINRLCFFSYDPQLYRNLDCEIFQVKHNPEIIDIYDEVGEIKSENIPPQDINLAFKRAIRFSNCICQYKEGSRNNFIYLLSCNCFRANIPMGDAQNLILSKYKYDKAEISKTVKSAYEGAKKSQTEKSALFSFNLLNLKKYKSEIDFDERIMFEALLIKLVHFKGPFFLSYAMIEKEMGIKKSRATKIIKKMVNSGLISSKVITSLEEGSPRQITYYTVQKNKIEEISRLMFEDNSAFFKRIAPLLAELDNPTPSK